MGILLSFFALATLLVFVPPAGAQETTGSVIGTVTDSSGGVIAGATVTVHDADRGLSYTAQTNESGLYTLNRVPVGNYDLVVEAKGFQKALYPTFTLVLNQVAKVDVQLKVGQATETVEVTSAPPILQTQTTELSTVIDARTNVALPLASRNYIQLTLLAPGSVTPNPQTLTTAQRIDSAGRPYINGNREESNNFLLDGMDNNQVSDNLVGYQPSPDAIQEFNLITQNAPAEFGNFSGGIVSVSLKSGTNQYHGDAFEFFRNDVLNANSWQNGLTDPVTPKAALRWNQFGATFGGPVIKNKVFFFVDYQGQRFDHPSTTTAYTVFTANERTGDFGILCTGAGGAFGPGGTTCPGGTQLKNPNTGNPVPFNNLATAGLAPNSVAAALFANSLYPQPVNANLTNNAFYTTNSALNVDQGDAKVDWNITEKDHFSGRYSEERQANPDSTSVPILQLNFGNAKIRSGVFSWTHVFSPTLLNEFRAGANYVDLATVNSGLSPVVGDLGTAIGIPNDNENGPGLVQISQNIQSAGATLGNVTSFGGADVEQDFADTVFQYEDNLTINHGRHTFRVGFQYWRQRINTYYSGNNGVAGFFDFGGTYTGAPESDFYLGMADHNGRGIVGGTWGQRSSVFGGYAQDDWRVTDTLTLNLGLRYQAHTPWSEVHNQQVNFGLYSGTPEYPAGFAVPSNGDCPGCNPGVNSNSRALYNGYYGIADFEPRIGIAWSPAVLNGKTVFRGAFTTSDYLEGTGTNLRLTLNPPFGTEDYTSYDPLNANVPPTLISDGLTLSPPTDPFSGATLRVWNPNVRPALAYEWNFSAQQRLNNNTTFQLGYVGQKGTHLMVPTWLLQGDLQANGTVTPSPYLAGNPGLLADGVTAKGTFSNGSMRYDALQAVLQQHYANGLQYQVSYTYSHCLTNSSGYYGSWGGQTTPASPYWQNLYDPKAEWGNCYYDLNQDLTAYAVYDIPVGNGRKYGHDMGKVANAVVGGWAISPIWTWHGGFPIDISSGDFSGTGSQGARADCSGGPQYIKKQSTVPGLAGIQWFNPSVYSNPQDGTFGSCGVAPVRGPGLNTVDASLQKSFALGEVRRLEFRTDFINAFNHPILNSPANSCSGDAGQACGSGLGLVNTSQGERNIQFALKFYF